MEEGEGRHKDPGTPTDQGSCWVWMLMEIQKRGMRAEKVGGTGESFPPVKVDREVSGTGELYTGEGARGEDSGR